MSLLKKLFGGGDAPVQKAAEPTTYKDFAIRPDPVKDGGQYRISAHIEKDGKSHHLIRADTLASLDEATEASVRKAKQMIDEQGDRLLG